MLLELQGIERSFEDKQVLKGVSLKIQKGEIVALLGPSGCGKTTLLRIIAGLETTDAGQLQLNGRDLSGIPVHKRNFGLVFQDYALFPHKSVKENVAFGLRMMRWDQNRQDRRVEQVLGFVGLSGFENRRVYELSGGEQQRVALARSLAPSPSLVLLDEPLGALDRALREQLMGELRMILKQAGSSLEEIGSPTAPSTEKRPDGPDANSLGMTSIYVTHDQEEAFAVADRIIVMNAGKIEQEGIPVDLYRSPDSKFVAHFLGMDNFLAIESWSGESHCVSTEIGELTISNTPERKVGQTFLLVRPEAGTIVSSGEQGMNIVTGIVQDISFRGRHQIATITIAGRTGDVGLRLTFGSSVNLPPEKNVITVNLNPDELLLLTR